jgi:hypothetical protein
VADARLRHRAPPRFPERRLLRGPHVCIGRGS